MPPPIPGSATLSRDQVRRVDALLDELLELPESQRITTLSRRAVGDPQVAAAVESMLHAVSASAGFLGTPARPHFDQVASQTSVGARLGAWRLTRLIGHGGMGDVYEADRADGEFEQRVAVKILQREADDELKRFQAERQILARLEHSGIARLYDGGITPDGRLYMVMEYVEGCSITDHCAQHAANLAQRLELFIQVCEAVSYAHRHQVIHRDLKASNILVSVDGAVKLVDFGIAKLLDWQLARVTHAAVPMTPICAAPEQLTGNPTTPATDVYALGLLLFELLTGVHAWMSMNMPILQAMRLVLERAAPLASSAAEREPDPPVSARRLRGDLDAIVGKCLRQEPEHRYATVHALQSDVVHVLRGEVVDARRNARLYLLGHTLRRRRGMLIAGSLALSALAIGWRTVPHRLPASAPGASHAIALVGFANLSGQERDAWLAPALMEMIGTELSGSDTLRVIPEEIVRDMNQGSQLAGAGGYGPDTLRRLGRRLGADYLISGNYWVASAATDAPLRIDVTVQNVETGALVARFAQQAGLVDLADLVKKSGVVLRGRLGVPVANDVSLAQIANAQPPSVDLAQKMSIAHEAMQHYDAAKARDALLQVIAEAPGFAPAYANLSDAWSALGYREKALAAAAQALRNAAGLSAEMQLRIDASLQTANYNWAKAAADWTALIKRRPANLEYRLQAIDALLVAGRSAASQTSLAELRRAPGAAQDPRVELAAARVAGVLNDPKSCADHAQRALQLADTWGAPGLAADARSELGGAQLYLGNLDAAARELTAAIESYRTVGNPHGEAKARRTLATVKFGQHHPDEGRAEIHRALAIAQGIGDIGGVSVIYRNLSSILWNEGDLDGAQEAAKHGLELSRETGDLRMQAWTLRAITNVASDQAASDQVMRDSREVTALTERSGDLGGHVWSLATYADLLRIRGEIAQARGFCGPAMAEAARLSDPQFMIYSTFNCALVEFDAGEPGKAAVMLERVKAQAEAAANAIYLPNSLQILAQIDMERGDCKTALELIVKAVDGFDAADARTGQADAEALRAMCYDQLGDARRRDVALSKARALRTAITARQEVYFVDIAAARFGGSGRYREAIARLTAMSEDAAQRHWLVWSLEAKLAAWQLARSSGEHAIAVQLRDDLERVAHAHNMGRVLSRIRQLSAREA